MSDRKRGEGGEYTNKVTARDIVTVFKKETNDGQWSLKTTHVHDGLKDHFDVDVAAETVRRRLKAMRDDGLVTSEAAGMASRGTWWSLTSVPNKHEK